MLALALLLAAADPNATFPPPTEKVRVRAVQVMEPPLIDGVLADLHVLAMNTQRFLPSPALTVKRACLTRAGWKASSLLPEMR